MAVESGEKDERETRVIIFIQRRGRRRRGRKCICIRDREERDMWGVNTRARVKAPRSYAAANPRKLALLLPASCYVYARSRRYVCMCREEKETAIAAKNPNWVRATQRKQQQESNSYAKNTKYKRAIKTLIAIYVPQAMETC